MECEELCSGISPIRPNANFSTRAKLFISFFFTVADTRTVIKKIPPRHKQRL